MRLPCADRFAQLSRTGQQLRLPGKLLVRLGTERGGLGLCGGNLRRRLCPPAVALRQASGKGFALAFQIFKTCTQALKQDVKVVLPSLQTKNLVLRRPLLALRRFQLVPRLFQLPVQLLRLGLRLTQAAVQRLCFSVKLLQLRRPA
ncbi:hypothetical protein SDC9_86454 [bioreactor metagenome]|uniref:Uncharacterized protein n=1 Tax=bioreactor metagenome TaxID=1076179 RepID=A0A644ZHM8_9ZZZZ